MDAHFDLIAVLNRARQQGNESTTVEFKHYVDPSKNETFFLLLKEIAAMANGESTGFVFIGVHDKSHEVVGVADKIFQRFDGANIHRKVSAFLTPPPTVHVHRFEFEGKKVVGVVVEPFEEIPTFVSQGFAGYSPGTIFVRTPGGESEPASTEHDIRRMCRRIVDKHVMQAADSYRRYIGSAELRDDAATDLPAVRSGVTKQTAKEHVGRKHLQAASPT